MTTLLSSASFMWTTSRWQAPKKRWVKLGSCPGTARTPVPWITQSQLVSTWDVNTVLRLMRYPNVIGVIRIDLDMEQLLKQVVEL